MNNRTLPVTQVQNRIGASRKTPTEGPVHSVTNPATGEQITEFHESTQGDVDEAVTAGRDAFDAWKNTPVEARIQPLFEFKQLLEEHQDNIAETIVREHGKTLEEARGEIRRGIENVEVACGIPSLMQGGHLQNAAPDIDETAVRKPLGVFAAVTPFNFPAMIPLWFLPYSVATGNAFILKPSEKCPLTAQYLIELAIEAGFPDGVVQLVNGGADTVNALIEHSDIAGISFVGSSPVAKHVYESAAKHGKRVQAQGGAKNHIIVAASADLDFAAAQTVSSAFANTGQRCLANPVAVVEDDVYDAFAERVVDEAENMTVENGLGEDTDMGPLISEVHRQNVLSYVETGIEEDGEVLLDGREFDVSTDGNFLGPTIFGDVDPDATIAEEEIFGPVLALVRAEDFNHALELVNQSDFGNASSLFTDRGSDAKRFRHEVDVGNLAVNAGTAAPMAFFHFGGRKASFFGDLHAQSEDMIHFYTDKSIYIERWPNTQ